MTDMSEATATAAAFYDGFKSGRREGFFDGYNIGYADTERNPATAWAKYRPDATPVEETPAEKPKKMDAGFAVFNCHVNDAEKRARQAMIDLGPVGIKWLEEIDALEAEGGGIMYIHRVAPTPAIGCFVGLVTAFVNENRE